MKRCGRCNTHIADETKYCPNCGEKTGNAVGAQRTRTPARSIHNKLHCPYCGSRELSMTTESSVGSGMTTNINKKTAMTVLSNTHKNFWMCHECGRKFRNIQNLEEEIAGEENKIRMFTKLQAVLGICSVVMALMGLLVPFLFIISVVGFFGVALWGFLKSMAVKQCAPLKKELSFLKKRCFD